ncbi:MAG: GatB/YqeY domain-containing protein [Acidobacteria bacterium]|nr:GatB/YqeY domain-containing protein [Acidobacteriota bacterium]MDW7984239.1 GatB/YqeY domain-containing protein [Acidobacteriota bacterium]
MGEISRRVEQDWKDALRAHRRDEVNVLRLIRTELQYAAKDKQAELTEAEEVAILERMLKKRREALEMYRQGGRPDMIAQEETEIAIIERYLPRSLGRDEILPIIEEVIRQTGARGPRDFGRVMGLVMQRLKGHRVDGAQVRVWVEERLAQGDR